MECMDLWAVVPEMIVAGMGLALVPVAGWARGHWQRVPAGFALVGLIAAMATTGTLLSAPPQEVFCGTYAVDPFRAFYQLLIQTGALVALLMLASHLHGHPQEAQAPVAVLLATAGAMGVVASLDLGLIVLFLQMVSFPSYLLVGLVRSDRRAQEATLKYFLYGAAALAIMAYGLTFLFGLTGSLNLRAIGAALHGADAVWVVVALGFVVIGYGFEMTIVPFQFWAPDVFQGATAPAAGFVSAVPKVAAFGGLLRLLIEAIPEQSTRWPLLVAMIAVATMTFGNLVALRQTSLKRLLAYSSIAQAGYILIAVAVAKRADDALAAIGFYLLAYVFMNLLAFTVIAQIERATGRDSIDLVRGFGRAAPWPAAALSLALLSLAGIPPLAGFAGKVFVLTAAINGGMTWLAVIAAINMALALYYYVAIIAEMYFRASDKPVSVASGFGYAAALWLGSLGTVLFGVMPGVALALAKFGALLLR